MISKCEWHDYAGYLHHRRNMKINIIDGSEVSRLSVAIQVIDLQQ